MTLGENCFEQFQILLDGDPDKKLHPEMTNAGKDVCVIGPSGAKEAEGKHWMLDARTFIPAGDGTDYVPGEYDEEIAAGPDQGKPGHKYKIHLEIQGKYRNVSWEKMMRLMDGKIVPVCGDAAPG